MKAITGGTILTPERTIKNGTILIKDGKIVFVGKRIKIPENTEILDEKEKYIIPGFVDGHSHVGMVTDGIDWEDSDVNDFYGPVTAHLRAVDGLNLYDDGFRDALTGGVTTVYTGPGSSNPIGGIGAIVKTYAKTREKMVIKEIASVKMALGPKRSPENAKPKTPYPTTRMGTVSKIREMLMKATSYMNGKLDVDKLDKEEEMILETLSMLLRGDVVAHIHTSNMPDEILAAIRLLEEFKVKALIDHGFGSELVAELLAEKEIPVIYGPLLMARKSAGLRYVNDGAPAILSSKGVKTSIMTDNPVIPGKYLRLSALIAIKNNMNPIEALKAITINPSKAIGIEHRVGSIEPGKDGDLVILSRDPFKIKSIVEKVFIDGEIAYQI